MLPPLLSCRGYCATRAVDTAYRALCPTACSHGMLVSLIPIPAGLLVHTQPFPSLSSFPGPGPVVPVGYPPSTNHTQLCNRSCSNKTHLMGGEVCLLKNIATGLLITGIGHPQ